jgi:hypothetical protein
MLWAGWAISEEGQESMLRPAKLPPILTWKRSRPNAACMLSGDDIKEFPEYEKLWKEIFQIR